MNKATLNKNGITTKPGNITVYNFDKTNREYISSVTEYLAVGVGIPANACTDAPLEEKKGFAICRTEKFDGWEYVIDNRGKVVYATETGLQSTQTELGDYPDDITPLSPATPYDRWNGVKWETDADKQSDAMRFEASQEKAALLSKAQNTISLWQTELQLNMITEENKSRLIEWLKYIHNLNNIDTNQATEISWPEQPK